VSVAGTAATPYAVFSTDAGSLRYRLHVAAPLRRGAARPLFVMLHGAMQSADDFAIGTRMNQLADECGGVVLYPEQSKSANAMGCWNWYETRHQAADEGEPALIAGLTRHVMVEQGVDPARVYVAGMSAGGAMAVIMGETYPELYAAVGVHSGLPWGVAHDLMSGLSAMSSGPGRSSGASSRGGMPTIVFHGDRDTTVHPSNAEAIHAQPMSPASRPGHLAVPGVEHIAEHTEAHAQGHAFTRSLQMTGGVPRELWIVHGAGHAWAGGSPDGSYTDSHGPDASREMVRFFLQQKLQLSRAGSA
jgi:poly(hydroxyalkanoate) depolymerase family esterase